MLKRRIYRVGEVTGYLRDLLEADPLLNDLWVRGEISNFKRHPSGHLYFTLKDSDGSLRCMMFRARSSRLQFLPADGMGVLARGYISIYERDGLCQFYVEELSPDGQGALYLAFCNLKERLQREGLFAPEHKKPLPYLPRKIGVVTSPAGAAWRDLITIIRRRFPGMPVVLAPAAVQGEQAPGEICEALAALNKRCDIDVIIVGRGGGSLEELWAFNTEEVARAIFRSRIPVVSAVGHETDYTIADLVADLRAPTPSAAAEMVVPCRVELEEKIRRLKERLEKAISVNLSVRWERTRAYSEKNLGGYLKRIIRLHKQDIRILRLRLGSGMRALLDRSAGETRALAGKLNALNPLAVLERGFSLCLNPQTGGIVRDSAAVEIGDTVTVILRKGSLSCRVQGKKEDPEWKNRKTGKSH
ncbi:exodeoxyribonuclease VII large subunit XseA [Thermacetogenium phaeum DSM 12270]|uniref:Exodeoxyribonuclease 7 large subunit n=1 Tax=Thermacetogenium phaeum (strain ATCC BAA-254 / DSM 26808 / PB) TaxID=1089553 RepID=K4LIR2_THEPS|nr:exodeoxyribonuclease VII large subunit [Thermacetogenium phaeum]AFV11835.1 exodeoxyribonuclease VII large subunit XseA [Thermacetogenium phaeum DSM 12270]